jgi:superfamily I DNA/RNA helicase
MVRLPDIIDWKQYLECYRGLLIAPAGHGKTTAIADCLLQCPDQSCHLVLTHTHAGIASLRSKFHQKCVPHNRYQLETITGFAQRLVLSILGSSSLPTEDDATYFDSAINKCYELMQSDVIQLIIKNSYNSIFVDEYQDCTIDQHNMIMSLSDKLPLHLLGDPLQGIFSFESKRLVDFDKDFFFFQRFYLLNYPWRWDKTNIALGKQILQLRKSIEAKLPVILKTNNATNFIIEQYDPNCNQYGSEYLRWLRNIFRKYDSESLLVIYPSYRERNTHGQSLLRGDLSDRIKLKSLIDYTNTFNIVDAIDSSEYYSCAKQIDKYLLNCREGKKIKRIARLYDILENLHTNISSLNKWICKNENRFIPRTKENAQASIQIIALYDEFEHRMNINSLIRLIDYIFNLKDMKCHYKGLYYELRHAANIAATESISLFEAMRMIKNRTRHIGRKIEGRCIGTTLLTKGLEFDTVIIYNAHKFEDSKNFYVAISRACRRLVIITCSSKLEFKD